jgi:hypothetical protein
MKNEGREAFARLLSGIRAGSRARTAVGREKTRTDECAPETAGLAPEARVAVIPARFGVCVTDAAAPTTEQSEATEWD